MTVDHFASVEIAIVAVAVLVLAAFFWMVLRNRTGKKQWTVIGGRLQIATYMVITAVFLALTVVCWMAFGARTGVLGAVATVSMIWQSAALLRARKKSRDPRDSKAARARAKPLLWVHGARNDHGSVEV